MKRIIQNIIACTAFALVAIHAEAESLEKSLSMYFSEQGLGQVDVESIRYSPETSEREQLYLLIALNSSIQQSHYGLQRQIHTVCTMVLRDVPLLTELAARGYNMVSVSFDQQSQYDCL